MNSTITHFLDGMRQSRYVVRRLSMHEFDDHSLSRWDVTITIHHEMAVNAWIRRSLTF